METLGGKGMKMRAIGGNGKDVAKNPGSDEARLVLKKGDVTAEGNFGRIPGVEDNSGVHPYGAN